MRRATGARVAQDLWLRVAQADPTATFFHSPHWGEVVASAYGGDSYALDVSGDGEVLYPLVSRARRGPRWLAVTESTFSGCYGGAICARSLSSAEHSRANVAAADHAPGSFRATLTGAAAEAPVPARLGATRDVTHVLNIGRPWAEVLAGFSQGHRRAYNRSIREGLTVVRDDLPDVGAYWAMYRDQLARWGDTASSSYPRAIFDALGRCATAHPGVVGLWWALADGDRQAAVWSFHWNSTVSLWHATAADERASMTSPATLLYAEVARLSAVSGDVRMDFNPSGGHEGPLAFKRRFGAQEFPVLRIASDPWKSRVVENALSRYRRLRQR